MNTKKVNVQMLEPQPTNGIRTIDTSSSQTIAKPNVSCRFLSIGDVIYGKDHYGIREVLKIEKVTRTQGICGDIRFKIQVFNDSGRVVKIGQVYGWNSTSYYLETPELKENYYRQIAVKKLREFDYSILSTEVLTKLLSLVNGS